MNTKKLLSMLLVSLGVFSLGLTACDDPAENPSEPTDSPTVEDSSTDETPSDSQPDTPSDSQPDDTDPGTTDPGTTDPGTTDPGTTDPGTTDPGTTDPGTTDPGTTDPGTEVPPDDLPPSTYYDVTFNYDDWKNGVTVWTDYAIDGSVAPDPLGISEVDLEGCHTVPISEGGLDLGSYYFAIDANGYIVYASYGLGLGYGSPTDGYYHNQASKDPALAEYWSLHEKWDRWPNVTDDGRDAWKLYDFLIPEGGFVVKGYAKDPEFVSIWTLLTGQPTAPVSTNTTLEENTTPGALNKWYFSINEDHQLEIRERLAEETVDAYGDQEIETPSKNFTPSAADEPVAYNTLEGVDALADNTTIENTKVVVVWVRSSNAIVQDVQGNNILIYDPAMQEVAVGDTLVLGSAVKTTYNGYPELMTLTDVQTLTAYGKLPAVAPVELTAENVAEYWVEANNYGFFRLVGAKVIGEKQVQLGETVIDLYSTTFPTTVAVGDTVDIELTMQCYKGAVQGKGNTEDISRYYNIRFDADGDSTTESLLEAASTGAELSVTASKADANYQFSHWAKVVVDAEGNETLEKVSDSATLTITVGEADEEYVAVFDYAAWNLLDETYANTFDSTVKVGVDCGGDAISVLTDPNTILHADGAWTGGFCNTSWRYIIIVDAEGKVAYAVYNPANGYGGPNGSGYYAHPDYAEDYTTNPAFNILDGYGPWVQGGTAHNLFELKVPEGGFIVLGHGTGTSQLVTALTNGAITEGTDTTIATMNSREGLDHSARLFFDSATETLKIYVDENNPEAEFQGLVNTQGTDLPTVYNDKAENITLGDFTVAVDANGKVVFASKTASGYGGPADGFYHDGSYAWEAGKQCGIFVLDPLFAPWPATAEIDGVSVNAWTLYTVKAPEGGYIVTGTEAQMTELLKAIDPSFAAANNYFEGVADGLFNDTHVLAVEEGKKVAAMDLTITQPESSEGLAWGGSSAGSFTLEDGLYKATFSLGEWQNIIFTFTDAEGNQVLINHENTTITGTVRAKGEYGADWTSNLYHDDAADEAAGKFIACGAYTYDAVYDAENKTLTISLHVEEEPDPEPEPEPVLPDPVNVSALVPTTVNVFTSASENIELGEYVIAVDANGKVIYASAYAGGYGGPADGFYHDGSYALVAGQQCGIFNVDSRFAGWPTKVEIDGVEVNAWTLYEVVAPEGVTIYSGSAADMLPLVNAIFDANLTELSGNAFLEGLEDGSHNHKVVALTPMVNVEAEVSAEVNVFTAASENIELGEYVIAVDANGKVIYASAFAGGYGGPADGFYHDGSYALVAGQQCGIFNVDSRFAGWPTKVEIDGVEVNAWTLYEVVAPEGVTIYSGTAAQMLPLVNAIFDANLTELSGNAFLEGLADGSHNHKVVKLTQAEPEVVAPTPVVETFNWANGLGTISADSKTLTIDCGNYVITLYQNTSSSAPKNTYDQVRVYQDHIFTITAKDGYDILGWSFTDVGGKNPTSIDLSVDENAALLSYTAESNVWTVTASEALESIAVKTTKQMRFTSIEVTIVEDSTETAE